NTGPWCSSGTRRSHGGRRPAAESQEMLTSGTAAALDQPFTVRVVVIGQLLALPDLPGSANPDHPVDDVDVAVRTAGMVDEPGVVAADAGVDHGPVGQLEAPDVAVLDVAPLALQAHLVGDLLAGVVD